MVESRWSLISFLHTKCLGIWKENWETFFLLYISTSARTNSCIQNFFVKKDILCVIKVRKTTTPWSITLTFKNFVQTRCITVINFYTLTLVSSLIWSFKWPNFLSCVGIRIDFCACNCKRMMRKIIAIHNIVNLNLI